MLGTIANSLGIIVGSLIGLMCGGFIPDRYHTTVLHSLGLAVILIGLKMAFKTDELLLVILCMAIGSVAGELVRIERRLENLGRWFEIKFAKSEGGISKGFVTASLLFCVGSMAIVGSLESGLAGDHHTLFAKSVLDGIGSIIFASSLGVGVLFSSVSVFIYQGFITVTASFTKQFLIAAVINQMSAVGGLLIIAMGFNMLEIVRLKVGNMLPAIFLPLIYFIIKRMLNLV